MSLFLKIFLWFWLAIALLIGVFSFVSWTTQNEPFVRQWRILMADSFNIQAQTAGQIYENEGLAGLQEYLGRLKSSDRVTAVAFFDQNRHLISGDELPASGIRLFETALQSDTIEFDRLPEDTFVGRRISLKNGGDFVMIVQYKRPQPAVTPDVNTLILRIVALILTGGLVCYGLARYLTSPVGKLRAATRKIASGELQTRVGEKAGKGGDELALLAKDFDEMAERIESLVTSEKRLTRDISHELRSPLARMNVALEIARQKSNPETRPVLERIEKESVRLNEMISRLLTLSKLESGGEELDKQVIDLKKLVEETVSDADFEAQAKNKAVRLTTLENSRFMGREDLLRSAVENVLRNAVRYTAENSAVEVALRNLNGDAVIEIRDHGGGVPDDELENLFRPFYRIGEARERTSGGVGLGLAIAQRAVFAHKGTIRAKNTGDGLEVEIKLPRTGAR
ncbi:MAG: HAMP domain-containing protein [Acidobacteria bacterium]|nr:HAMP domain-containing protein [Acidobacteriota bacterium]